MIDNADEFVRRVRKWARRHNLGFDVTSERGKGSHVTVTVADRRTTVPRTIKRGLFMAMCRQLNIPPEEL